MAKSKRLQTRRETVPIVRWNSWFEKKSASHTLFWLFALRDIAGTMSTDSSGGTTESFIYIKIPARLALSRRRAIESYAVLCPPFTICKPTDFMIRS